MMQRRLAPWLRRTTTLISCIALLCHCGGEDETTARGTTSGTGGGSTAQGGAGGMATGGAGGGTRLPPGEVAWSVEVIPERVSGSLFAVSDVAVSPDGRAFWVNCIRCPTNLGWGGITVRDAAGTETELDADCSAMTGGFRHNRCHLLGTDADGALTTDFAFTITGSAGAYMVEATEDAVVAELRVGGDPGFTLETAQTMDSQPGDGRVHIAITPDGQELEALAAPISLAVDSSTNFSCFDYARDGSATFERTYPIVSGPSGEAHGALVGGRCLGVGRLRGPDATVDGQPVATPAFGTVGFLAMLDQSGAGPITLMETVDSVDTQVVAGHPTAGAFGVSLMLGGSIGVAGETVDLPVAEDKTLVVQVDENGVYQRHTLFIAEGGPSGFIDTVHTWGLSYTPDGRLAFLGESVGRMREYQGTELVSDHGDVIDGTFLAEISTETGRVQWTATPFEGFLARPYIAVNGSHLVHRGKLDEQPVTIGGRTFTTPHATVITMLGF